MTFIILLSLTMYLDFSFCSLVPLCMQAQRKVEVEHARDFVGA